MEVGRVQNMENERISQVEKSQKVSEINNEQKIFDNEEYKKANKDAPISSLNEVMIDNVTFGYNRDSKDFFIKITKGEAEFRFPTEDMMKIRANLLAEVAAILEKENKG